MFEYLIFVLPILFLGFEIYHKVFQAEESAIAFINTRNRYGPKGHMLRSPFYFLGLLSFILSVFFIPLGWAWCALGAFIMSGTVAYLIFSDGKEVTPDLVSSDFDIFVLKRKRQALVSCIVALVWILSWWWV